MEVTQKAKAGDVGAGVNREVPAQLRGGFVQCGHGGNGGIQGLRAGLVYPAGGADDAHTQGLGENQSVSGPALVVGVHPAGMNQSGDGQAVFHSVVGNGVTSGQHAPGLDYLLAASLKNPTQHVQIHLLREAYNVQGGFHLAPHGVDVAEGVGSGNLAEQVGVFHHGREKVQGLDKGQVLPNLIYGGIIPAVVADEQVRVLRTPGQPLQNPAEHPGTQLGGTAPAFAE